MTLKEQLLQEINQRNMWAEIGYALYDSQYVPPERRHGHIKEIVMFVLDTNPEAISCKTCGRITQYLGDRLCTNCWEVESRLAEYAKSERGRQKLLEFAHPGD